MTPTDACATPIIDRIKRLIRDLEAGALLGYDGPQEHWSTRMGAEASSEVARLLSAALAVEAGADARLHDDKAPMADGGDVKMTAAEEVLAWLLIEKIGVPDDVTYTPDDAQRIITARLSELARLEETAPPSELDQTERTLDKLETIAAPDNGTPYEVLAAVLECANAWVPEARILGNVRAGDISRVLSALTTSPASSGVEGEALAEASELYRYCGADAYKWAEQFRLTALRLGYSDMDHGWLIGWFANAIEYSISVRHPAAPAPQTEERDRG